MNSEYPFVIVDDLQDGDTIYYDQAINRWRTKPATNSVAVITDVVAEEGDLPTDPPSDPAALVVVTATGEGWMYLGGAWRNIGSIQGPAGASGPELAPGDGIEIVMEGGVAVISASTGYSATWEWDQPLSVGEWPIPDKANFIFVQFWAAGGGGGSGRRGAAGTARYGGAGGASGNYWQGTFPLAHLRTQGYTSLFVEGILGSPGGAAITTNDTNGNPGGNTGIATLRGIAGNDATTIVRVAGGRGGAGGGTTKPAGGLQGQYYGLFPGRRGLDGYGGSDVPSGFEGAIGHILGMDDPASTGYSLGWWPQAPSGGGGGGGGFTTANAIVSGSSGVNGAGYLPNGATVGAAGVNGDRHGKNAAFAGATTTTGILVGAGAGGGGGYPSASVSGGNGGQGIRGGGGGGGAASVNGQNSGAGARGGPGYCRILAW